MVDDNLIVLQAAHVTQLTDNGKKSPWMVRENITSNDLAELPKEFTEAQVFAVLAFARKFELIAFNTGIGHGKEISRGVLSPVIKELHLKMSLAIAENERIATALEKHIISKE